MTGAYNAAVEVLLVLWDTLEEMSPYILLGFLVAGVLSIFIPTSFVETHLGGRGTKPILKSSLFGVPLPLCSCGVIPVAASIRRHGAGRGAVAAFLISTPQTGVDSILATYALLGPLLAIFRPVAAFLSGVVGGLLVDRIAPDGETQARTEPCREACCAPAGKQSRWVRALRHGFVTLAGDIAKPLLLGLMAAGLIAVLVPDDFFTAQIGAGWAAMLLMLAFGIPLYVCATASVPIAAAMMAKGVSPGAALVFLMTGPATNIAAIATLWHILGRRAAIIYLLAVAGTALAAGWILDALVDGLALPVNVHMHRMLPAGLKTASAFALLGILAYALARNRHGD